MQDYLALVARPARFLTSQIYKSLKKEVGIYWTDVGLQATAIASISISTPPGSAAA